MKIRNRSGRIGLQIKRFVQAASVALTILLVTHPVFAQDNREALMRQQTERVPELLQQRADAQSRALLAGLPLRVALATGQVAELQFYIGDRPIYYITDNAVAADTVSTDEVQPGGDAGLSLDGAGQTIGIWDGGNIRDTHQELTGRVINNDSAGLSSHSTHVAGTIIASGVNPAAKGMAFGASVRGWDFNNDVSEMISEQASGSPVIVSNHSYGFITGWIYNWLGDGLWAWFGDLSVSTEEDWVFGFYSGTARDWDELAYNSPNYIMVKSAGNDRNDGPSPGSLHNHWDGGWVLSTDTHPLDGSPDGYDSIGGGAGSSKNVLTIGAVDDIPGGYTGADDVVMSSFSGWGPTDDGRIKPDLVANGIGLTSSVASGDSSYSSYNGTSMSSPNTAGSLGLLNQHAEMLFGGPLRGATVRALAIHSADDAGAVGPDYIYGWGLLNTETAARIMTEDSLGLPTSEIHELVLTDGGVETVFFSAIADTGAIRVTAVWTDPAGTPPAVSLDPATPMLVNDLDIRLLDPDGTTHEPWVLDPSTPSAPATSGDNVLDALEQIVVSPPIIGTYRVDIAHKGGLQGGVSQPFSLIISNGDAVNQAPVVAAGADQSITLPSAATLDGTVSDDGLPDGTLTTGWTQTSGPGTSTFADASAVDTTASFSVEGTYVLRLTASDGALSSFDELTVTVAVAPPNQAPVVAAGSDQSITLPSAATLDGTVSDDGLPDGTLTTIWTQTSGPGTSTFADASAVDTTASFSVEGSYVLRLTASDGALSSFDELVVTVAAAPPNQAPVVAAGADQSITLPSAATLDGTVSDDGLPDGTLTTIWTQTSGPGTSTFADASAVDTTASFSVEGSYVLRLTASDGALSSFDELTVTVSASARVVADLQVLYTFDQSADADVIDVSGVAAALDLTIEDPANAARTGDDGLLLNPTTRVSNGADSNKIYSAATASNELTVEAWIVSDSDSQSGAARIVTLSLSPFDRNFTLGQDGNRYEVRLRTTSNGNNGTLVRLFSSPGSAGNTLTHVLFTRSAAGAATLYIDGIAVDAASIGGDFSNWNAAYDFALGNEFSTASTNTVRDWLGEYRLVAIYNRALSAAEATQNFNAGPGGEPPSNQAPVVAAGADQSITLPSAATLDGTVSDDGLPDGTLTTGWTQTSGPGTSTFADASAVDTTASFSVEGTYVLRLTASDGVLSSFDELTVTVAAAPPNQAPVVAAGADQSITLPSAATLDGTVSDDGLPDGTLTTGWTQTSGPGTSTFADASAVDTTASFSVEGTYVLRLTASDGALSSFDELTVTVAAAPPNQAPVVAAGADQSITLPSAATLDGTVSDDGLPDGTLTTSWTQTSGPGTSTFADASAVDTTASFSVEGSYVLRLTASDGALSSFDELTVTVAVAPPNQAPVVAAGADQSITLPSAATLDGTVSDDGLPDGTLTTSWTQTSGPGTSTFADASAVDTTASFSVEGSYVLRLTASDGALSSFDELTVTVSASARVVADLQVLYTFDQSADANVIDVSGVAAALDLTIEDPANAARTGDDGLLLNPTTRVSNGADSNKIYSAATASNELTVEAWIVSDSDSQSGAARIVTLSLSPFDRNFTLGQDGNRYEVRLRTTSNGNNGTLVRLYSSPGSAGNTLTHVLFTRSAAGAATLYIDGIAVDAATIGGDFSNWNAAYDFALGNEFSTASTNTVRDWLGEYRLVAIYNRALSAAEATQNFNAGPGGEPPSNQAPVVAAGADQSITLPSAATLDGTVSDDGLPDGTLTTSWTQTSGPGTSTFADASAVDTTASFSVEGSYVLRLTASDGALSSFDELTVTVAAAPPNQAPVVAAGADQSITLPSAATLDGTVSDDGLPDGTLTTSWTQTSGPGTSTFADASAVDTTASFSVEGSYVLRLTASDGALSSFDELTVTVAAAPPNQAPVVAAGADQSITLPSAATLDGTVSDDGLPDGTLTTSWTQTSGPGTSTFADASAVDTTASFSVEGSYVLRLTASDGALSSFDELTVTVAAAPPNQAPVVAAGADQSITLPSAATLDGTVSDDGLPDGTLTTSWTQTSGPGTSTFADASAVDTTASFSVEGSYVLRLTASDGALSSFDELTVTVSASARVVADLQVLYTFDQSADANVIDVSGVAAALDLTIEDPANAARTGDDGLLLNPTTRVSNGVDSNKIYSAATASNELTVEAWIVSDSDTQSGAARIVTLSSSPYDRNFTLGQDGNRYEMRLRTTSNGNNGTLVRLYSSPGSAGNTLTHVLFTRSAAGAATLYIDGIAVDAATIGGDFSNWNAAYDFALGNEFSTASTNTVRDWLGEYRLVAIYNRALSAAEATQNFNAGP